MDNWIKGWREINERNFTGLSPADRQLWKRYVADPVIDFDEIRFNVRCGKPAQVLGGQDRWYQKWVMGATRKRIDVVARKGPVIYVIEIKPFAWGKAVGQAMLYSWLFMRENVPGELVRPMIITDWADGDICPFCDHVGILVVEVGTPAGKGKGPVFGSARG